MHLSIYTYVYMYIYIYIYICVCLYKGAGEQAPAAGSEGRGSPERSALSLIYTVYYNIL